MGSAAIDYGRSSDHKAKLQNATDAAALAAAHAAKAKKGDPSATAKQVFLANANADELKVPSHGLQVEGSQFTYFASGSIKNSFSRLFGREGTEISARSVATFSTPTGKPTEIAIVIDVTNSMVMSGGTWGPAVAAIAGMLTTLKSQSSGEFYVTLIPMSDRINVGWRPSWMASNPAPAGFRGCVEPREVNIPGYPYAVTDDPPTGAGKFQPSEVGSLISPQIGSFYVAQGMGTDARPRCSKMQLTGPTTNVAEIEATMNSPHMDGTGRYDEGMAWAWRALSPQWRGHWGVPNYPAKKGDRRKIAVFITDGFHAIAERELGGAAGNIFGMNLGSQSTFDHFIRICNEMKKQDIEIFTLFAPGNIHYEPSAKQCATSVDKHYMKFSNIDGLKKALESIASGSGSKTEQVRLIK
jgi:hypothetical protein